MALNIDVCINPYKNGGIRKFTPNLEASTNTLCLLDSQRQGKIGKLKLQLPIIKKDKSVNEFFNQLK